MSRNHFLFEKHGPGLRWAIVSRHRYLWVVELAGKRFELRFKPLRLKGRPRYSVPPDCDPTMW